MIFAEFLRRVNVVLEQMSAENRHSRSYIRLLRPYNEKKLNIIGSFEEALALEAHSVMTFSREARKSFGIVPEETFEKIRDLALGANSIFASVECFKKYVEENWRNFCTDPDEFQNCFSHAVSQGWVHLDVFDQDMREAYRSAFCKALYARCLLQATRVSGFWMRSFRNNAKDDDLLKTILDKDVMVDKTVLAKTWDKRSGVFRVCGRMLDSTLSALDEHFRFEVRTLPNDMVVLDILPRTQQGGADFVNLYDKKYARTYTFSGSAIYSGVIPRLCHVEYVEPQMGNEEIQQMRLILGRTTYMTMYGLNSSDILNHPFLNMIRENLSNSCGRVVSLTLRELNILFDQMEIRAQEEYWSNMSHHCGMPDAVVEDELTKEDFRICNEYLAHSWNIHNINISGNLITADGYCIYTRRGHDVVDSGNLYCSVNGGCELVDSQVSFYRSSVPEDLPTIQYGSQPVYFGGELTREAIGELGIGDTSVQWNYYGVSLMGRNLKANHGVRQTIWFHFNVLGERQCLDTFDSILESKKLAAESFESEEMFGYKMLPFSTIPEMVSWMFIAVIKRILENSGVLSFFVMAYAVYRGQSQLDLNNKLVCAIGILASILFVYKTIAFAISYRTKRIVVSWQNKGRVVFEKLLKNSLLGRGKQKDPVFMALIALRFMRVFRN